MSVIILAIGYLFGTILGLVLGVVGLYAYMLRRMMKNPGWDKSNITNAQRVLSHVVLHTPDLGRMRYESGARPFWYIDKDEFSEVVKTRP